MKDNTVLQQDCIEGMRAIEAGSVDLIFADPPFNIGYKYDVYHDSRESDDYLCWCEDWLREVSRILKDDGTFWLAIGDEYAAELKVRMQGDIGLTCRSWVIWYYTFGVNCKANFSRSHTHLFYMVKDPKRFTFNLDDPSVRIPSARQLVYGDKRANPKGRLPDNTWILRPQDLEEGFVADEDTWYFPRVCGTFKQREGWHGCQMPEQLLGRIIRACSNEGELVLDPFAGSGTTLAVAKKLGRRYLGFELSGEYHGRVVERLDSIRSGDVLHGAADAISSAPKTSEGRRLGDVKATGRKRKSVSEKKEISPDVEEDATLSTQAPVAESEITITESAMDGNDGSAKPSRKKAGEKKKAERKETTKKASKKKSADKKASSQSSSRKTAVKKKPSQKKAKTNVADQPAKKRGKAAKTTKGDAGTKEKTPKKASPSKSRGAKKTVAGRGGRRKKSDANHARPLFDKLHEG